MAFLRPIPSRTALSAARFPSGCGGVVLAVAGPVLRWARARGPLPWWAGTALVLGLGGERRSRRAALRGLLAVVLTMIAAPPRSRYRRVRSQDLAEVAAASAFAVGAGLESRQAGPAARRLLPALLTGLSWWLRRGGGSPIPLSKFSAGAALGSTAALSSLRVWKVPPAEPATARIVSAPVAGRLSPQGAGLCVVVNSQAGPAGRRHGRGPRQQRRSRDEFRSRDGTWRRRARAGTAVHLRGSTEGAVAAVVKALPAAKVIMVEGEDLVEVLEQAANSMAIGIVGGDGSVRAAAEVALRAGLPLAVIPGGTLNHFARDVGLAGVDDTIEAVQHGELEAVDVGLIDGRVFLNTASFGSYAAMVDAREDLEARLGKWLAMLVGMVRVLRRSEPVRVELDGEPLSLWAIFIGNSAYDPPGMAPSWRVRLDDGLLDVRLVRSEVPFSRVRLVLAVAAGQLSSSGVYERRLVRRLCVRSRQGPLRLAADGETFDAAGSTVLIEKSQQRLAVYSPSRRRAGGN